MRASCHTSPTKRPRRHVFSMQCHSNNDRTKPRGDGGGAKSAEEELGGKVGGVGSRLKHRVACQIGVEPMLPPPSIRRAAPCLGVRFLRFAMKPNAPLLDGLLLAAFTVGSNKLASATATLGLASEKPRSCECGAACLAWPDCVFATVGHDRRGHARRPWPMMHGRTLLAAER